MSLSQHEAADMIVEAPETSQQQFQQQEERRAWLLRAFADAGHFASTDPDFRGNRAYETKQLQQQRDAVESGKYRVVFLGAFNVGKSTALNAFLGGEYLPVDVEECTSRLTFIQRGEQLELVLHLDSEASLQEISSLEQVLDPIGASVAPSEDRRQLHVNYAETSPDHMRKSLEPLVTVLADEDFPKLASLRAKIEELYLLLPAELLEEDIVFIDTPGVHTVSETRQEITYNIIERSHLVIDFVDSNFAGNVHDINFIKRIIKWRGRHVFFVLNKADKLEPEEIDPTGAQGPARSLLESFQRNEIPDDYEIFFLSGYRALRALQLRHGHISMENTDEDNRLAVPTEVLEEVAGTEEPAQALAEFLMEASHFPALKERLLEYLLQENKLGIVLSTASRYLWGRADNFAAPLENELNLAKDPSKFEGLRENRESLLKKLDDVRGSADHALNVYKARSMGGVVEGEQAPSHATAFREALSAEAVQTNVVEPVLAWLRAENNLRKARSAKFRPLAAQVEHHVDEFVSRLLAQTSARVETDEKALREAVSSVLGQVRDLRAGMTAPNAVEQAANEMGAANQYLSRDGGGAPLGSTIGAAAESLAPILGSAMGAGLGGLMGSLRAFFARLTWNDERWLQQLEPLVRDNAMNMLVHGSQAKDGSRIPPVAEAVSARLDERAETFCKAVQQEIDEAVSAVQRECDDLLAREEQIRKESEAIIARLQPKTDMLHALCTQAAEIVAENEPREALT